MRKICVITGSRADYGLLRSVMTKVNHEPNLTLQVIATGSHLSPAFGFTYKEIEKDGFEIDRKIECLSGTDDAIGITTAIANTLQGCALALQELAPDIVLILGDRFEIFAAATSALIAGIPIAHIHGGESTIGAYDEAFRHSITKMAHIHFVATRDYRRRVIQLGENPKSVFEVGGVGIDDINDLHLLNRKELEQKLGIEFKPKSLLVTFHPATLDEVPSQVQASELLSALADFTDITLIFTSSNADTEGLELNKLIKNFVQRNENAYYFDSLGRHLYLSCLANVNGVIGNSSSGILEAPSFKKGTINIGNRQTGRSQSASIINSEPTKKAIKAAIEQLFSQQFISILQSSHNPYGTGGASSKIVDVLARIPLKRVIQKKFYDIKFASNEMDKQK